MGPSDYVSHVHTYAYANMACKVNTRITRSCKTSSVSFEDILSENRVCVKPSYKRAIDAFVAEKFTRRGMVDDVALAEYVLNVDVDMYDEGNMTVLGYTIAKYCDANNPDVKRFLREYRGIFDSFATFQVMVKSFFGMIPMNKNCALHFRKFTGDLCTISGF